MKIKKLFGSKKGAGASSTFDSILTVGTVVVTGIFIIYFLSQGLELVDYYRHLNTRLTAESMAGLTSALSVAPGDMNLTYNMESGPKTSCKLILWGKGNNIYTGMDISTEAKTRFTELVDLINNKIKNKCGGKDVECLENTEMEDETTLMKALVRLAFGARCPESSFVKLRNNIGEWFHNRNKVVNPGNIRSALSQIVVGSCRNLVVVDKNTVVQLGFKSSAIAAPKPENIKISSDGKNRVECSNKDNKDVKFVLFKKNNELGIKEA